MSSSQPAASSPRTSLLLSPPCEGGRPVSWMFSSPTQPSRSQDRQRLRVLRVVAVVEAHHDRLAGPSGAPSRQLAASWSSVTACQPAAASACICSPNSSAPRTGRGTARRPAGRRSRGTSGSARRRCPGCPLARAPWWPAPVCRAARRTPAASRRLAAARRAGGGRPRAPRPPWPRGRASRRRRELSTAAATAASSTTAARPSTSSRRRRVRVRRSAWRAARRVSRVERLVHVSRRPGWRAAAGRAAAGRRPAAAAPSPASAPCARSSRMMIGSASIVCVRMPPASCIRMIAPGWAPSSARCDDHGRRAARSRRCPPTTAPSAGAAGAVARIVVALKEPYGGRNRSGRAAAEQFHPGDLFEELFVLVVRRQLGQHRVGLGVVADHVAVARSRARSRRRSTAASARSRRTWRAPRSARAR